MKLSGATRVEWMRERRAGVEARAGWRAFEEAAARVCGREPWERPGRCCPTWVSAAGRCGRTPTGRWGDSYAARASAGQRETLSLLNGVCASATRDHTWGETARGGPLVTPRIRGADTSLPVGRMAGSWRSPWRLHPGERDGVGFARRFLQPNPTAFRPRFLASSSSSSQRHQPGDGHNPPSSPVSSRPPASPLSRFRSTADFRVKATTRSWPPGPPRPLPLLSLPFSFYRSPSVVFLLSFTFSQLYPRVLSSPSLPLYLSHSILPPLPFVSSFPVFSSLIPFLFLPFFLISPLSLLPSSHPSSYSPFLLSPTPFPSFPPLPLSPLPSSHHHADTPSIPPPRLLF